MTHQQANVIARQATLTCFAPPPPTTSWYVYMRPFLDPPVYPFGLASWRDSTFLVDGSLVQCANRVLQTG